MEARAFPSTIAVAGRNPNRHQHNRVISRSIFYMSSRHVIHLIAKAHAAHACTLYAGPAHPIHSVPPLPQPPAAGAALRCRGEMGLEDPQSGCRRSARRSRDAQLLQQTLPAEASGSGGNLLGLWTKARVEGWRGSAESEGKRMENTEPPASGRGARVSSLQQQPEQNVGRQRPQRQLHIKILGAIGRRTTQGTGFQSAYLNLVPRKVVPVVWCEADEASKCAAKWEEMGSERAER